MAPFALVLMASGLALFWAVPFWGAAKLGKPVTILALWPLAEYARSVLVLGISMGIECLRLGRHTRRADCSVGRPSRTWCAHFGARGFARFRRATPWKARWDLRACLV